MRFPLSRHEPATYFDNLSQDLVALGRKKRFNEDELRPIRDYDQLYEAVRWASINIDLSRIKDEKITAKESQLTTSLARYALQLAHIPYRETRTYYDIGICEEAEGYFAEAMQQSEIQDEKRFSPVIVTRGDEPVGIIKFVKNVSYYALQHDKNSLTYSGHIYWTTLFDKVNDFTKSLAESHAWHIPIDEIESQLRNGRLSTTLIPHADRENLAGFMNTPNEYAAMRLRHSALLAGAWQALKNSERIELASARSEACVTPVELITTPVVQ